MKTVCERNKCAGCMACIDVCRYEAISIRDDLESYNAIIDEGKCVNCGLCKKVCQRNNSEQGMEPFAWYQGWAEDNKIRKRASSGGIATAISSSFIKEGGIVCSCTFCKGVFQFEFAERIEELDKFVGSKYVKSNPIGIYKEINEQLRKGKRVLFIGLPCQVAALKTYVGDNLGINLYTIDLICHGTPSPKLLQLFLNQYQTSLALLTDIKFRVKGKLQLHCDNQGIIPKGVTDKYNIAFLNSLTYTENCYECNYAKKERVSDLTIGDSWGSDLPKKMTKEGVSLMLCQSEKGMLLLKKANIHMEAVNIEKAIAHNSNLRSPSIMPHKRKHFFNAMQKGKKFNRLVFAYYPAQCLKQDLKEMLIKMKIIS